MIGCVVQHFLTLIPLKFYSKVFFNSDLDIFDAIHVGRASSVIAGGSREAGHGITYRQKLDKDHRFEVWATCSCFRGATHNG